jgi:hypothetical protein
MAANAFIVEVPCSYPRKETPPLAAAEAVEPETIHILRHRTISLAPITGAQALYELARSSMEIVPHVLVDAAAAQMGMIEECLEILKAISDRAWSCGRPGRARCA